MDMYLHDSSEMFCFVLRGDLAGVFVRELESAWTTARSILGARNLIVDISGLTDTDESGRELLNRLHQSGARLIREKPARNAKPVYRRLHTFLRAAFRAGRLRRLAGSRRCRLRLDQRNPRLGLERNLH
jgi:hypothetical protein